MTRTKALWLGPLCIGLLGCRAPTPVLGVATIAQQYGLAGATAESITTSGSVVEGTLVPITMAGGQQAHLFIPTYQSRDVDAVYLRDDQGLHPVRLTSSASREDMVRSPALAATGPARQVAAKRSWEREVLIVAGNAGAGAAIGGLAKGKKGAAVGAAAGGVGGLVYDLITRHKE